MAPEGPAAGGGGGRRAGAALRLLRALGPCPAPGQVEDALRLAGPEAAGAVLAGAPQPLRVAEGAEGPGGRRFLLCDANRVGDSYRDPFANAYRPPRPDAPLPAAGVRAVEEAANDLYETYCHQYHGSGTSSVFVSEAPGGRLLGYFAFKKVVRSDDGRGAGEGGTTGAWDGYHVVRAPAESAPEAPAQAEVRSTVLLSLSTDSGLSIQGALVGGGGSRPAEEAPQPGGAWPVVAGGALEAVDNGIRARAVAIYFEKARQVGVGLRSRKEAARKLAEMESKPAAIMGHALPKLVT